MPPAGDDASRRWRAVAAGPALALVAAGALELVRATGLPLHSPAPLLAPLVAFVALRFGVRAGLLAAGVVWLDTMRWLSSGGWPPMLVAGEVGELTGWAVALPALVLAVASFRRGARGADSARAEPAGGEQRYRDLFDSSPVEIWEEDFSAVREYLDRAGFLAAPDPAAFLREHPDVVRGALERVRVLDVNRQAVERLGAADKAELMRSLGRVFTAAALEAFEHELVAIHRGETRLALESRSRTLDGRDLDTVLHWEVQPGHERDLGRVLVSVLDVTEQRALRAEIERIERLESVGKLAGGVAHDFNNRLTVILSSLSLLRRELAGRPRELQEIGRIEQAAQQAADLTRQLLAFGRRQVLRPALIDLNRALRTLGEDGLARSVPESIVLRFALEADPALVAIDPQQLDDVVLGLVGNAVDAMPGGGEIEIATRRAAAPPAVESSRGATATEAPADGVVLSVRDTGTGMDAETLAHCFEPFFTTKSAASGSGLGLSTAHGIVEQSGGTIWAESAPGRGSTFFVWLPAAREEKEDSRPAPRARPARAVPRALVVDDDDAVRTLVARMLSDLGYLVDETRSPVEALATATGEERFDLLLTDVVMPEMSGYTLAERVARARPETAIVLMSGYERDAEGHRPGVAVRFLPKPFTRQRLEQVLRESAGPR